MSTRNIHLTEHFDQFVEDEVNAGRYQDASEVMRAGLNLLEQQRREEHEKLELLRSLAAEGFRQIDQGLGIELKDDQELADFIEQIDRRVVTKARQRSQET
jgi:antitoxin ParD1/3/4